MELLADDARTQPVGGGLQGLHVVHREEGVIVFVEADAVALQFPLDEGVAIEPVRGMERKETGHPYNDRPEYLVADVEVVVCETASLHRQDAVVGILGGILGHR